MWSIHSSWEWEYNTNTRFKYPRESIYPQPSLQWFQTIPLFPYLFTQWMLAGLFLCGTFHVCYFPCLSMTILTSVYSPMFNEIFVWDVQTGMVIKHQDNWDSNKFIFSGNHKTATLLWSNGTFHMYDEPSGTYVYRDTLAPSAGFLLDSHWVHKESLRFPTIFENNGKFVFSIQELQPNSFPPLSSVMSFPVPSHTGKCSFSPISFHISFVTMTDVIILNVQDSRMLLQAKATHSPYTPPGHFSPNGHFFACGTEGQGICVWKNTSADYIPWSNLQPRLPFKGFSFSPTKSSILTWGRKGVQLLEPGSYPTNLSPNKLDLYPRDKNHLVGYSADGTYIATAWKEDNIVTVLDTLSNTPQQSFDVNMQILDIKIINKIVFAAGMQRLVKWHLEMGEIASDSYNTIGLTINEPFETLSVALSDNCSYIAFAIQTRVSLYDVQAQKILHILAVDGWVMDIRFSPNGCQLWMISSDFFHNNHLMKLELDEDRPVTTEDLSDGWSWFNLFSPHYWHVGRMSEWVEDSRGNKLVWLPFSWRTENWQDIRWDGNFLTLVGCHHPESIIIKLQP